MARLRPIALLLGLLVPAAGPAGAAEVLVDGIAAQVGGDIVLVSEVRELAAPGEARLREIGAPPSEIARLRAEVLESLVERALIQQVVTRSELGASEEEVDAAIAAIAKENQLSLEQLRASVEGQGLSFEDYRVKIRSEIERTKVVNGMVASRVRVDEADVRLLYTEEFAEQPQSGTEYHLRHLLVPVISKKPGELQKACTLAGQARAEIAKGVPFGQVAAQVSPVNPRQGGDIGWVHEKSLASWMKPVVESLAPGQTSAVIETSFGCNLLELVDKRSFTPLTFEQAQERLYQQLFQEQLREEYIRFIERLRGRTYIQRKGYFADAARLGDEPPVAADGAVAADGGAAAGTGSQPAPGP